MTDFQSKIFNKLKCEETAKPDISSIFKKIHNTAANAFGDAVSNKKDEEYKSNIFQKIKNNSKSESVSDRIFDCLKSTKSVCGSKKGAFFTTAESLDEIKTLIDFLDTDQLYSWQFFFDQMDLDHRQHLASLLSSKVSLSFDYKLSQPENLVKDFDLIIVLSPDEFSHKLAIEAVRKGKNAVSTMTVQGSTNGGRHYHAESISQLLKLLPNIVK